MMRVMHQWGKCGQICSISSAVLDTFTRDNTHQRAILSINHGGTLSLNLWHGKGPRELPVLLQGEKTYIVSRRRDLFFVFQKSSKRIDRELERDGELILILFLALADISHSHSHWQQPSSRRSFPTDNKIWVLLRVRVGPKRRQPQIGACRHGERCSRLHNKPTISQTLLLVNMYQVRLCDALSSICSSSHLTIPSSLPFSSSF